MNNIINKIYNKILITTKFINLTYHSNYYIIQNINYDFIFINSLIRNIIYYIVIFIV